MQSRDEFEYKTKDESINETNLKNSLFQRFLKAAYKNDSAEITHIIDELISLASNEEEHIEITNYLLEIVCTISNVKIVDYVVNIPGASLAHVPDLLIKICLHHTNTLSERKAILEWLLENNRYAQLNNDIKEEHIKAALGDYKVLKSKAYLPVDKSGFSPLHYALLSGVQYSSDLTFLHHPKAAEYLNSDEDSIIIVLAAVKKFRTIWQILCLNQKINIHLNMVLNEKNNYSLESKNTLGEILIMQNQFELFESIFKNSPAHKINLMREITPAIDSKFHTVNLAWLLSKHDNPELLLAICTNHNIDINLNMQAKYHTGSYGESIAMNLLHNSANLGMRKAFMRIYEGNEDKTIHLGAKVTYASKYQGCNLAYILSQNKDWMMLIKLLNDNPNEFIDLSTQPDKLPGPPLSILLAQSKRYDILYELLKRYNKHNCKFDVNDHIYVDGREFIYLKDLLSEDEELIKNNHLGLFDELAKRHIFNNYETMDIDHLTNHLTKKFINHPLFKNLGSVKSDKIKENKIPVSMDTKPSTKPKSQSIRDVLRKVGLPNNNNLNSETNIKKLEEIKLTEEEKLKNSEDKFNEIITEILENKLSHTFIKENNNKYKLTITGDQTHILKLSNLLKPMIKTIHKHVQCIGPVNIKGNNFMSISFTSPFNALTNLFNSKVGKNIGEIINKTNYTPGFLLFSNHNIAILNDKEQDEWKKSLLPAFCFAGEMNIAWDNNTQNITIKFPEDKIISVRGYKSSHGSEQKCQLTNDFILYNIFSRLKSFLEKKQYAKVEIDEERLFLIIYPYISTIEPLSNLHIDIHNQLVKSGFIQKEFVEQETEDLNKKEVKKQAIEENFDEKLLTFAAKEIKSHLELQDNDENKFAESIKNLFAKIGETLLVDHPIFSFLKISKHKKKWIIEHPTGNERIKNLDAKCFYQAISKSLTDIININIYDYSEQQNIIKIVVGPIENDKIMIDNNQIAELQLRFTKAYSNLDPQFSQELAIATVPLMKESKKEKTNLEVHKEKLNLNYIKLENFKEHINTILDVSNKLNDNPECYSKIYLLHVLRILHPLAGTNLKQKDLFNDCRNVIRHAYKQMDWQRFFNAIHPIILHLNESIMAVNNKQQGKAKKFVLFSHGVEVSKTIMLQLQEMAEKLHSVLTPFADSIKNKELGKTNQGLTNNGEYKKMLAQIDTYDLDPKHKRDLIIMLYALIGKTEKRLNYGEVYRQIGHDGYNEYFNDFANDLFNNVIKEDYNNRYSFK